MTWANRWSHLEPRRDYTRPDWYAVAACEGMGKAGHELFFEPAFEAHAKAVCHGCPVEDICLEYAIAQREDYGVWGGKSEAERKSMRRRRFREAKALAS
jgi:WhiB family redox-sensing transcriptional regulator